MSGRGHGRGSGRGRPEPRSGQNSGRGRQVHRFITDAQAAQGVGRGRGRSMDSRTGSNSSRLGERSQPSTSSGTSSTVNYSLEQNRVKSFNTAVERPSNSAPLAKDFDELSDNVRICHINQTELYLSLPKGQKEKDEAEFPNGAVFDCFCSDFLWPGLKPNFPKFPKGKNPFEILPIVQDGIYPFDTYGKLVFNKPTLDRWRKAPRSADLLEVQIRKLVQRDKLNGRWDECYVTSEYASFGSLHEWRFGRFDSNELKPVQPELAEPDSGFSELVTFSVDPLAGDYRSKLADNTSKWKPGTGCGYVTDNGKQVGFLACSIELDFCMYLYSDEFL